MDTSSSSSSSSVVATAAASAASVVSNSDSIGGGSSVHPPGYGDAFTATCQGTDTVCGLPLQLSSPAFIHNPTSATYVGRQKSHSKKSSTAIDTNTVFRPKSTAPNDGQPLRFSPYCAPSLSHPTLPTTVEEASLGQLAVDTLYRIGAVNEPINIKWAYQQGQIHPPLYAADGYAHSPMSGATAAAAAAAAAAASAAVSKFEHQAAAPAMTNLALSGVGWQAVTNEWDLQAGVGKTDGYSFDLPSKPLNGFNELDPRLIGTSPYYGIGNYGSCAASNMRAAYLASYPQSQNYIRDQSAAAAAVAAAAAPLNFNFSAATSTYGYGNNGVCPSNFVDYYYGNGAAAASVAAMIGSSPAAATSASLNTTELVSGRSSSSGNNTTANASDDFKSLNGINEEYFMAHESGLPAVNTLHHNLSPANRNGTKQTSKQKKSKKKKVINGDNMVDSGQAGVMNNRAGSASRMTPEPSSTHTFVWELEDLCSASDNFTQQLVDQIVSCAFHVDPIDELNELNQINIADAEIDDSLAEHNEIYPDNVLQVVNMKTNSDAWNTGNTDIGSMTTAAAEMLVAHHANATNLANLYAEQPPSTSNTYTAGFMVNGVPIGNPNGNSAHATNGANMINREMLESIRRVAMKYRNVRATYQVYQNDVAGNYDKLSGRLLERYKRCLRIIVERSQVMKERCTNILITQEPLMRAIAKVLVLGLGPLIPIENIYSIQRIGRDVAFTRITDRFKKQYAVSVTSNAEMRASSRKHGINCWFVHHLDDVDKLYLALDTLILFDPVRPTTDENVAQNDHQVNSHSPADKNNKIYDAS